jgi:hypothetical protein
VVLTTCFGNLARIMNEKLIFNRRCEFWLTVDKISLTRYEEKTLKSRDLEEWFSVDEFF